MNRSLESLLAHAMDYSGVFPPARLPLPEAIRNYAGYRRAAEAWMLGRLVCPAAALNDAGAVLRELFPAGEPCRLVVIGTEHPLQPEFVLDLRQIDHFRHTFGEHAQIDGLEVRLPHEVTAEWDPDLVAEGLSVLAMRLNEHGFDALRVFIEPVLGEDWIDAVQNVVAALKRHDLEHGDPAPNRIGFKLRTGGLTVDVIPTVEQVAYVILACREVNIPLKLTAGLHQPLFHVDQQLEAPVHGFLNVLVAGVLAQSRGVEEQTLREIVSEKDSVALRFDERELRWRNLQATIDEIETARRELVVAFASCSFDEPRAGLARLGLV